MEVSQASGLMQPVFQGSMSSSLFVPRIFRISFSHPLTHKSLRSVPSPRPELSLTFHSQERTKDRKQLGSIPGGKSSTHLFLNGDKSTGEKEEALISGNKVESERVLVMMGNIYSFGGLICQSLSNTLNVNPANLSTLNSYSSLNSPAFIMLSHLHSGASSP